MMNRKQSGVTLIELMVAVAIVGVLAAISLPMYSDYVDTARRGVMIDNMQSIRLFEEEARLSNGSYVAGIYDDSATLDDADNLALTIGWSPRTSTDDIRYVVDNISTTSFRITASMDSGSVQEVRTFSR